MIHHEFPQAVQDLIHHPLHLTSINEVTLARPRVDYGGLAIPLPFSLLTGIHPLVEAVVELLQILLELPHGIINIVDLRLHGCYFRSELIGFLLETLHICASHIGHFFE